MRAGHTTTIIGIMLILQLVIAFSSPLQTNAQNINSENGNGVMYNSSKRYGHSELPQVAAYGNNVYVVWLDDILGSRDVFLRKSTDGGNSFGKVINLSNNVALSFQPQLALSDRDDNNNNVNVAWIRIHSSIENKQHLPSYDLLG